MFECPVCDRTFHSGRALDQHQDAKEHYEEVEQYYSSEEEEDERPYCSDCDRYFDSAANLRQHLHSRVHQGQNIACPFCSIKFVTASGLTHHLERGACPKARSMNRDEMYRFVRSKDPAGHISKKLIGWEGSMIAKATEQAWNGRAYACYLCNRDFRYLNGLNQHLSSPAHQQALYYCPGRNCQSDFKTLAALINHLENESCGFMTFRKVQKSIRGLVDGNHLLGY